MKIILFIIAAVAVLSINNIHDKNITDKNTDDNIVSVKDNSNKEENLITENQDIKNDEEIVNYIETIDEKIKDSSTTDNSIKEKLKDTYITLTDFIFYGGSIKGRTFDSLTISAKNKILSLYESIDKKIENKYPNYKETIKDKGEKTYSNTKDKIIELEKSIKEKYNSYITNPDNKDVTNSFQNDKQTVKDTYTNVKDKIVDWFNKRGD